MTADAELLRIRSKHRPAPGDAALLHRIRYGIWRHRMPIVAVLLSVVVTGGMLGYLVRVMSRERNTPLLVNVTARQRTLVERYIKDVVLKLDGVPTAPEASATVMVASADALLRGGMVVSPNGDPERLVHVPAVRGWKAQAKLTQERGLINELTDRGSALLAEGRQSPTYATDLRLLRILGAELSSVTSDAANEITLDAHASLSRLEVVAVLAGVIGALLSCVVIVVLRRAAQRASARFRTLVHNSTDMITVVGTWTSTGAAAPSPVGSRFELGRSRRHCARLLVDEALALVVAEDHFIVGHRLQVLGKERNFASATRGVDHKLRNRETRRPSAQRLHDLETLLHSGAEVLPARHLVSHI